MKILYRYLYKKLTVYLLVIVPSFSIVAILVELIELLRKAKIMEPYSIFMFVIYQLPEKIYYILPISTVIAFFLLAKDLIKSREIYPILLNGISLKKIGMVLFIFPVVISFIQILNLELIMPEAKNKAEKIYHVIKNRPPEEPLIAYNSWVTINKETFLYFSFLDLKKKTGKGITIIKFDKDFNPVLRIDGKEFSIGKYIKIKNGKLIKFKDFYNLNMKKFKSFEFPEKIDINSFKKLIKIKKPVSIIQLYKSAIIAEKFGYPSTYFWSKFFSKLATVWAPLILTFTVYPLLWSRKKYNIGIIAVLILIYWYATAFLSSIAMGNIIPFYTIFAVDVIYIFLGFILFRKLSFSEL